MQFSISCELVRDELGCEKLGYSEYLCSRDTEKESNRVEDVSQYKLQRESVNTKTTPNPGQKTIGSSDQRQDCEYICQYLASDDEPE